MKVGIVRLATLLLFFPLLGCSGNSELEKLRAENAALKSTQGELEKKLAALQQQMSSKQPEKASVTMHEVEGTVTFEDKPILSGEITFIPNETEISPARGIIKDGQFTIKLKAGKHKVEITSKRGKGPLGDGVIKQYIPERYNTLTDLTFEVKPGTNTASFRLSSK